MYGKLQAEADTQYVLDNIGHSTMCYKTNGLFTEQHLQKMKFRLASFGERLCRTPVSGFF